MRAFILAVTGFGFIVVAACSSYGTSVVEVEQQAKIASLSISLPSPSLVAGQTQRGRVILKDASGAAISGRRVSWFTSSASIATVNDSGDIAAMNPGNATLSAVSEGVSGTAALTVMPRPPMPVAKVLVAINPAAVVVGQTAQASVALQDADGNPLSDRAVSWQTGNPSVATVSGSGSISAVGAGTTSITASSEGQAASASLSVSAPAPVPVATVSVSPATASVQVGATVQLSATTRDAGGATLTGRVVAWSSATPSVASVNSNGLVSAVAAGTAQITASSEGRTSTAAITVTAPPPPPPAPAPVATVSVSPATSSLLIGATVQLAATTRDASGNALTGRAVAWSSANSSVASVNSSSGLVTAVAAGTVQITATSEGKTGTATIAVSAPAAPVATVSVSPATSSVIIGNTVSLSATTRDASGNTLTGRAVAWSSANSSIASVNSSSGLVTAVAAGTAQITATSEGKTGNATITVSAPAPVPVATVSVSPATSSAIIGNTVSLSATTRDASGNVLTGRAIAWSSGNTAIATVNSTTGLVRAVAVGTVQVTATSEGKTGTATFTSQPLPPPPPPGTSNEPSGMTQIADRSFNALQEGSWYTDTRLSIVQDPTAPKSPNGVLRANFPSGFAGGTSDGPAELAFSSYKTLYISYWAKYSSNWQGHNTGINKHCYVWLTDAGGYTPFVMEAEGSGSSTLRPRPILQRMIKGDGPYAPNLVPGATIQRGTWFRIEIVIVGNSANTADGTMDIYLDGVHVTNVTGLQWSNGAARWNIFQFYPVWGGIGDTVNSTMTFDWDHVYLSGK